MSKASGQIPIMFAQNKLAIGLHLGFLVIRYEIFYKRPNIIKPSLNNKGKFIFLLSTKCLQIIIYFFYSERFQKQLRLQRMTVNGKKECPKYAGKKNYCPLQEIKESQHSGIT